MASAHGVYAEKMGRERGANRIERASPLDLMHLALQRATVPEQFGAILLLTPDSDFDVASAIGVLADRASAVPRLRQRIIGAPPGCGRAFWADDPGFGAERHIAHRVCPPPGDDVALLQVAADLVVRPLPLDRPLWAATLVTGLTGGRAAIVLLFQHALTDGIGGLAVLGALVDGATAPTPRAFPSPPPSWGQLAAEAFLTRARALASTPGRIRARSGSPRGRGPHIGRAAPCSLLEPTGPRRRVAVVATSLEAVRAVAHLHGVTVNDVVLTAIGGALHSCLKRRGEEVSEFVVGIPVSQRRTATPAALGNRFTETRAAIPGAGDAFDRLARISTLMRVSKKRTVPAWAGYVATELVRAAIALGVYDWYMRRQHYLHTVLANVHGPDRRQTFAGVPINRILPLAVGVGGNVTVSFTVLSYVDELTITVTADPDTMPDLSRTTAALQAELDALTAPPRTATGGPIVEGGTRTAGSTDHVGRPQADEDDRLGTMHGNAAERAGIVLGARPWSRDHGPRPRIGVCDRIGELPFVITACRPDSLG